MLSSFSFKPAFKYRKAPVTKIESDLEKRLSQLNMFPKLHKVKVVLSEVGRPLLYPKELYSFFYKLDYTVFKLVVISGYGIFLKCRPLTINKSEKENKLMKKKVLNEYTANWRDVSAISF